MKTVGLNLTGIFGTRNGGVGTYVSNVLPYLLEDNRLNWVIYANRTYPKEWDRFKHCRIGVCPFSGKNQIIRIFYEQFFLVDRAISDGCDLIFSPGYIGPITKKIPCIVTIHDTQYIDVPESLSKMRKFVYSTLVPRVARSSKKIITVSNYSKRRICDVLRADQNKVSVIYHGISRKNIDLSNRKRDFIFDKYKLRKRYILAVVSGGAKHKNVRRLIEAFSLLKREQIFDGDLVVAGRVGDIESKSESWNEDSVKLLGYIPSMDLADLYQNAMIFAMPSYYEGFGFPILEAMCYGVPVCSSNVASLPEVGGDAVVYFDPYSVSSIRDSLKSLIVDDRLREKIRKMGADRVNKFQWVSSARNTIDALLEVANMKSAAL